MLETMHLRTKCVPPPNEIWIREMELTEFGSFFLKFDNLLKCD